MLRVRDETARPALREALADLLVDDSPVLAARRDHVVGMLRLQDHQFDLALADLSRAELAYATAGSTAGVGQACDSLAAALALLGHVDAALLAATRSLACKILIGDEQGIAITLGTLGRLSLQAGRASEARWYFERNLTVAKGAVGRLAAQVWLVRAMIESGQIDEGLALSRALQESGLLGAADHDRRAFLGIAELAVLTAIGRRAELGAVTDRLRASRELVMPHTRLWIDLALATTAEGALAHQDALGVAVRARQAGIADVEARALLLAAGHADRADDRRDYLLRACGVASTHGLGRERDEAESLLLQHDCPPMVECDPPIPLGDEPSVIPRRYIIRARLGGGAQGEVLRAYDLRRNAEVAIKLLKVTPDLPAAQLTERLDSARREFELAQRLSDRGLARVFALGKTLNGQPFVVQEFVPGSTLRNRLPWTGDDVGRMQLLEALARTIDALHDQGLLHLDLKPDNIILREDGSPVLIDFGIAVLMEEGKAAAGVARGTPGYAAPEQRSGQAVTRAADVHAFGVLAHELLTGRLPATPESVESKGVLGRFARALAGGPATEKARLDEGLSEGVRAVLAPAIASDPGKRPTRTSEVVRALRSALG